MKRVNTVTESRKYWENRISFQVLYNLSINLIFYKINIKKQKI